MKQYLEDAVKTEKYKISMEKEKYEEANSAITSKGQSLKSIIEEI